MSATAGADGTGAALRQPQDKRQIQRRHRLSSWTRPLPRPEAPPLSRGPSSPAAHQGNSLVLLSSSHCLFSSVLGPGHPQGSEVRAGAAGRHGCRLCVQKRTACPGPEEVRGRQADTSGHAAEVGHKHGRHAGGGQLGPTLRGGGHSFRSSHTKESVWTSVTVGNTRDTGGWVLYRT